MGKTQSPSATKGKPEPFKEGVKAKKMKETHPIVSAFQFILMLTCCGVSCGRRGKDSLNSENEQLHKNDSRVTSSVPTGRSRSSGRQDRITTPDWTMRAQTVDHEINRKTTRSPTSIPPGVLKTPVEEISIVPESTRNKSVSLCWSSEHCCSLPSSLHSRGPQISRDAPSALSSTRPHCSPSRFSLSCMWKRRKSTISPTSDPPCRTQTPVEEISIVPEATFNPSVSQCPSSMSCCSLPSLHHSRGPQICKDAPPTASSSRPHSCPSRFSVSSMWKPRKSTKSPTSDPPGRTQTPVEEISIVPEATLKTSVSQCPSCAI